MNKYLNKYTQTYSNKYRYLELASFVKTVLCTVATSIPCERLFISAGYIVNKTLSSLESITVNMLVCLRCWLSDSILKKRLFHFLFLVKFVNKCIEKVLINRN